MDNRDTPPKISAIVCTWNNAQSLEATLESLARQQLPSVIGYEVIVVDNNSTDDTAAVAKRFIARHGERFRYVQELAQGLSFARNRGVAESRAEIVAFIDDDAVAEPTWLAELLSAYEQHPEAACVGGNVALRFPPERKPAWYSHKLDAYLSGHDLPPLQARSSKDFPIGTNISFRKSVLQQLGGFHPLLGARPLGRIKLQGDETQLCLRMLKQGMTIRSHPPARVVHAVTPNRLRKEYFLGLAKGNGYVQIILDNDGAIGVSTTEQLEKYVRRWFRRWREYLRKRASMSDADRFYEQLQLRATWASVTYCVWERRRLGNLARELEAGKTPNRPSRSFEA